MSKNLIFGGIGITILGLLAVGVFLSVNNSVEEKMGDGLMEDEEMTESSEEVSQDGIMKDDVRYVQYTPEKFEQSKSKKRVYFFHAAWCPTCKIANEEFNSNSASIPENIILFKTDYDTESELKQKFGITYQHTFVQVDEEGNEITKWNGGGLSELIANVK